MYFVGKNKNSFKMKQEIEAIFQRETKGFQINGVIKNEMAHELNNSFENQEELNKAIKEYKKNGFTVYANKEETIEEPGTTKKPSRNKSKK